MKKRDGVALISVVLLLAIAVILSITAMLLYSNTTKQNYMARDNQQANYLAISGLNIVTQYMSDYYTDFETNYTNHLNSSGNDRTVPFEIDLNLDDSMGGNTTVVSVTSEDPTASGSYLSTNYYLSAVGTYNGVEGKSNTVRVEVLTKSGSMPIINVYNYEH